MNGDVHTIKATTRKPAAAAPIPAMLTTAPLWGAGAGAVDGGKATDGDGEMADGGGDGGDSTGEGEEGGGVVDLAGAGVGLAGGEWDGGFDSGEGAGSPEAGVFAVGDGDGDCATAKPSRSDTINSEKTLESAIAVTVGEAWMERGIGKGWHNWRLEREREDLEREEFPLWKCTKEVCDVRYL